MALDMWHRSLITLNSNKMRCLKCVMGGLWGEAAAAERFDAYLSQKIALVTTLLKAVLNVFFSAHVRKVDENT